MSFRLSHLNLPARDPERLARWYADQLGLERRGAFLFSCGTLLVFEPGEPLGARGNTHFGFHLDSADEVRRWATHFSTSLEVEPGYASTKVSDPEGNCFELYWEPESLHPEPVA